MAPKSRAFWGRSQPTGSVFKMTQKIRLKMGIKLGQKGKANGGGYSAVAPSPSVLRFFCERSEQAALNE